MRNLDDVWDRSAPVGSKPWVIACAYDAEKQIRDARSEVGKLRITLKLLKENAYYRILENRKGVLFDAWEEFCAEPPPWGIGWKPTAANLLIDGGVTAEAMAEFIVAARDVGIDAKPLPRVMVETVKQAGGHGGVRVKAEYQVSHETLGGGQSPERVAARIKRDRPDIAERVMAGEFSSMRQAGLAAGIIKPKASVMLGNPEQVAHRIYAHDPAFADAVASHVAAILKSGK